MFFKMFIFKSQILILKIKSNYDFYFCGITISYALQSFVKICFIKQKLGIDILHYTYYSFTYFGSSMIV